MSGGAYDGFFIGWGKKLPAGLRPFLIASVLFLIGIFAGTAFSFVVTQDDPGEGRFRFDLGRQNIVGVIEARPYPVIHVAADEEFPNGRSIMLAGQGKRGVVDQAEKLQGKAVRASGVLLKRGDLAMLQVGRRLKVEDDIKPTAIPITSLGKWRLNGEICDGKCYAGAMRPGTGLAHKACANLCLVGGTPPVFSASGKVDGSSFFLLADEEGMPLDERLYGLTAIFMEAEGEIEKRGNIHVFKIDLDSVEIK